MSAHPGAKLLVASGTHSWRLRSTASQVLCLFEIRDFLLHFTETCYYYNVVLWDEANAARLASFISLMVACFHSECCVPSRLELPRLAALLYVIIRSILQQIWGLWVTVRASEHSFHGHMQKHLKKAPTPLIGRLVRCSVHGHSFARLW